MAKSKPSFKFRKIVNGGCHIVITQLTALLLVSFWSAIVSSSAVPVSAAETPSDTLGPVPSKLQIGGPGFPGGKAALLMAGRAPEIWAGVSAWCGIYDLAAWHQQKAGKRYWSALEAVCGGTPGTSPAVLRATKVKPPNCDRLAKEGI